MNKNVFTSSNVFISSLGLTPNYNMVFLIVKRGGQMIVLPTDNKDHNTHSPYTNMNPFLDRLKKISSSLYINFPVMYKEQDLDPKPNQHHICFSKNTDQKFQYHSWGYMIDWVGRTLSYGKYDPVNSLQEINFFIRRVGIFLVEGDKLYFLVIGFLIPLFYCLPSFIQISLSKKL